jgi:RimJ/RimL family protein N-acetyltransferase
MAPQARAGGLIPRREAIRPLPMHQVHVPLPVTTYYAPDYPVLTPRLVLRPFNRADVDAVHSYRSLPQVAEYLFDHPMSHDECAEAVRARTGQVAFVNAGDKILLAVEERQGGRVVGEVSLIWRHMADLQAEIGYILHPDAWGRGYATEAAGALLALAFREVGIHRVYARCDARNVRSARVMQRLGMRQEAHFRQHAQVKGRWDEELVFAILAHDWAERR